MKELKPRGPHYTAREIIEIIDRAREAGIRHLKLEGFEATWELEPDAEPPVRPVRDVEQGVQPVRQRMEPRRTTGPTHCSTCGDELVLGKTSGRYYCRNCYIERQEARKNGYNKRRS